MAEAWGYYHAAALRNGNDMVRVDHQSKQASKFDETLQRLTQQH